jgi:hypothetical protein
MSRELEMAMIGEFSFFFGLQVKQIKDETFICQSKYVNDLLKRFDMDNSEPIKTPMATNAHLDLDEGGKSIYLKFYKFIIGSLFYLTASRSNILFSVYMCARFQASPKECHMMAVKRILRYLRQAPNLGYSDFDYASCKIDRKSTLGTYQLLR